MQTKINSVTIEHVAKGRTGYDVAIVNYGDDKVKKIMSFANPAVFAAVQKLEGKEVEITVTKNGQFFEWAAINELGASTGNSTGNTKSPTAGGTTGWQGETKEERGTRQVLIVKQSSLSAAVGTLAPGSKAALDPNEVLELAQKYTDWVFDTNVS
jgi:hypothetical protein